MEEAKREGGDPRPALGEARLAVSRTNDLGGDERDGEGDRCLYRRAGEVEPAESRSGQRDRMRNREGGDRAEQSLQVANQQQQAEHEQEMVEPKQDVLDAEPEIGGRNIRPWLFGGNTRTGRRPVQPQRLGRARERFEADDGVSQCGVEILDVDLLADQAPGAGRAPALDHGGIHQRRSRLAGVGAAGRQDDVEREAHVALCRRLPQHVVAIRLNLADFEKSGADLVRERPWREAGQREQHQQDQPHVCHSPPVGSCFSGVVFGLGSGVVGKPL